MPVPAAWKLNENPPLHKPYGFVAGGGLWAMKEASKKSNRTSNRPKGGKREKAGRSSLVVALMAGAAVAAADSSIAGTWQGKIGMSRVTLTVKDDHGKLGGTAIFYKMWTMEAVHRSQARAARIMIDAKLEGKVFSFQTKGPQGESSSYQMELTGKK